MANVVIFEVYAESFFEFLKVFFIELDRCIFPLGKVFISSSEERAPSATVYQAHLLEN